MTDNTEPEAKEPEKNHYKILWLKSFALIQDTEARCSNRARRLISMDRSAIVSSRSNSINSTLVADGIIPFLVKAYVTGYQSITPEEDNDVYKKAAIYANTRHEDIVMLCDSFSVLIQNKPIMEQDDKHLRYVLNKIIRKIHELCRPEIFKAFNNGRYEAMSGCECVWVASPNTRCRDASNHGDKRMIGEEFETGHRFPGDNKLIATAECDCVICQA